MTTALTNLGRTVTSYPCNDNLESVVSDAVSACDVIYIPVDVAIASNASVIASVCISNQKPVITADAPDDFESNENVSVESEQDGIEQMTVEEIGQFESEVEIEE